MSNAEIRKTLVTSFALKNTYRVNTILYSLKQIPLIKRLFPAKIYGVAELKIFANILSVMWEISSVFLWKFLYFITMVCGVGVLYFELPAQKVFLHIILFLTIIGFILNTHLFNPTRDKYYAIVLLRIDAKEYTLVDYFYRLIKDIVGFLPMTLIFGSKNKPVFCAPEYYDFRLQRHDGNSGRGAYPGSAPVVYVAVDGSDNVDASVFDCFDYVALGHLHKPQNIVGSNRIRYCGTPLKYSFSEANHYKSVTVVELGAKGELQVHTLPLTPRHDLREISGTFAELTDRNYSSIAAADDYLHIILTDEEDVPEALGRLRVIYPNIMRLSYDNARTRSSQVIGSAEQVKSRSPLDLFEELYQLQNNQPMSEVQRAFTQELIESIQEGRV